MKELDEYRIDWIFEITRKCRCKCEFCLRGNPQNKQMEPFAFRRMIERMDVDNIFITGGEPLLNIPILRELLSFDLGMIGFITSGNIPKNTWNEVCDVLYMLKSNAFEFFMEKSIDKFHPKNNGFFWEAEDEWGFEFSGRDNLRSKEQIFMGRAQYGRDMEEYLFDTDTDDSLQLYVNVDGDVYPSCDLSYAFQRKYKKQLCLGNAINDSKEQIIKNYFDLTNGCGGKLIANNDGYKIEIEEYANN
jgi:MoaA/NifB/PqqE/SkfB family radical SAM enzyme